MPIIPQYTARYNRPAGTGMVPVSVVPDPLTGVGESIADAAEDIGSAIEARNERRRVTEFGMLAANFDRDLANDKAEYMLLKGADAYGSQDRLDKFGASALQRHKSKDPLVNEKLGLFIQDRLTSQIGPYSSYEAQQEEYEMRLSIDRILDTSIMKASNGDGTLQDNTDQYVAYVSLRHVMGDISPEEAEKRILEGQQRIASKTLEGMIYRSPDTAVEQLNSGVWNDKIHPDDLKRFRSAAKTASENAVKLRDANEDKLKKAAANSAVAEITDATLSGKPEEVGRLLLKHRDTLAAAGVYMTHADRYQKMVDNTNAKVSENTKIAAHNALSIKAILPKNQTVEEYTDEVALAMVKGEIPSTGDHSGFALIKKFEESKEKGASINAQYLDNAINTIQTMARNEVFGSLKSPGTSETVNKAINSVIAWHSLNPQAKKADYEALVHSIVKPPVHIIPETSKIKNILGGNLGGSLGDVINAIKNPKPLKKPAPEDVSREKFLEKISTSTEINIPSEHELERIAIQRKFTNMSQVVEYIKNTYHISSEQALAIVEAYRK